MYINFYVIYKNVKTYIKNKTFILCKLYFVKQSHKQKFYYFYDVIMQEAST